MLRLMNQEIQKSALIEALLRIAESGIIAGRLADDVLSVVDDMGKVMSPLTMQR